MCAGTGLTGFSERFPDRFFDVGIAEEHAVSMAAGMAKQGLLPVVAIYSGFLQRAYDMLIHDVSLQDLHVVFCVDRAGLVGNDGETHHGAFDISYLRSVPHMQVLCPANFAELEAMLDEAVNRPCRDQISARRRRPIHRLPYRRLHSSPQRKRHNYRRIRHRYKHCTQYGGHTRR